MSLKLVCAVVLCGLLALTVNCTGLDGPFQSDADGARPSKQSGAESKKQEDHSLTETQIKACFNGFPNLRKAWDLFAQSGRFRMAKATDFALPQVTLAEDGNLIKFVDAPCVLGQLRGEHSGTEFAAVVIDNQNSGEEQFGIVIFNGLEKGDAIPQPFWLIEQANLSRARIYRLSTEFIVSWYEPEGWIRGCVVRWDPKIDKYSCLPD